MSESKTTVTTAQPKAKATSSSTDPKSKEEITSNTNPAKPKDPKPRKREGFVCERCGQTYDTYEEVMACSYNHLKKMFGGGGGIGNN